MRNTVYPIWVFVAVAALIALFAFAVGQWIDGAGVIVAGAGSMIWTAYVARRGALIRNHRG